MRMRHLCSLAAIAALAVFLVGCGGRPSAPAVASNAPTSQPSNPTPPPEQASPSEPEDDSPAPSSPSGGGFTPPMDPMGTGAGMSGGGGESSPPPSNNGSQGFTPLDPMGVGAGMGGGSEQDSSQRSSRGGAPAGGSGFTPLDPTGTGAGMGGGGMMSSPDDDTGGTEDGMPAGFTPPGEGIAPGEGGGSGSAQAPGLPSLPGSGGPPGGMISGPDENTGGTEDGMPAGFQPPGSGRGGMASAPGLPSIPGGPANPGGAGGFRGPGGFGGPPQQQQTKPDPMDFAAMSKWSFSQGLDHEGASYYYAHLLSDEVAAETAFGGARWFGAQKRVVLALRMGVAVDSKFDGDPKPIGVDQAISTRGRGRRNRGGFAGPEPGGASGGAAAGAPGFPSGPGGLGGLAPPGVEGGGGGFPGGFPGAGAGGRSNSGVPSHTLLSRYGGELADRLLKSLYDRSRAGDFGQLWVNAPRVSPQANRGRGGRGFDGRGAGASRPGGGGFAGMDPSSAGAGFGGEPSGAGAGFGGGGAQISGAFGPGDGAIWPGMVVLGRGGISDLLRKAASEHLDLLFVFDVKAKSRNNVVENDTMIELYDVASGQQLDVRSRRFNNVSVQKYRSRDNDRDIVETSFDAFFRNFERNVALTDLPGGIAQGMHVRVPELAAAPTAKSNPLPLMTEVYFYWKAQWINDSQAQWAIGKLIGEARAEAWLTGDEKRKKEVLATIITS